jgi:hypothetical protein
VAVFRSSQFSHYAEPIAIRVGKHDVVGSVRIAPVHAPRAQADQPLDISRLVACVKVEVMALMILRQRRYLRDCYLCPYSFAWNKDCPIVGRLTQWAIVQGRDATN